MKLLKKLSLIATCTLLSAFQTSAEINILMNFEGVHIPKDFGSKSQMKGYDNGFINLLSASTGVSNAVNISSTSRGAGKPSFTDFEITKIADEITPILTYYAASGALFKKVTVTWLRNQGSNGAIKLMEFIMEDVYVSSCGMSSADGDDIPSEVASFAWSKMTIQSYTSINGAKPTLSNKTVLDRVGNTFTQ